MPAIAVQEVRDKHLRKRRLFMDRANNVFLWYSHDHARAVWSKARTEYRPIGKVAQEFLERALGADAPAGD